MTRKQFIWWLYAITTVILLFFVAPILVSAPSTLMVLMAVVLLVLYGVFTWHMWVKQLLDFIETFIEEHLREQK